MSPAQRQFLTDLAIKRGRPSVGTSQFWLIERNGGKIVSPTAFEPDPVTCRDEYYYNAVTNTLYKKVVTRRTRGVVAAYWQKVSE